MQTERSNKTYGEASPRDVFVMPWQEIHCDTIGPWTIDLRARKVTFSAMTIINACTNLVEIKVMKTKTSEEGAAAVENVGLIDQTLRDATDIAIINRISYKEIMS